ncbi:MAG: DUF1549 domain-containing protein [Planctomycetaceae bacterium]|nr:DUF1549 domain-containing protein [Planctomycetaceae bacterium]
MTTIIKLTGEKMIAQTVLKKTFLIAGLVACLLGSKSNAAVNFAEVSAQSAGDVAREIDRRAVEHLETMKVHPSAVTSDEDFLRRVSLDLTGVPPTAGEVTLFSFNPSSQKRAELIDQLLASDAYADNWSRYWRDVIFSRATDERTKRFQPVFESWLKERLADNQSWDEIVTQILTATGDVAEEGSTALLMVHGGQPAEIAAEASRIFLGIQIQCANCHDHPTDQWKRADFHELAAYFTRVQFRQQMDGERRTFVISSLEQGNRRGGAQDLMNNADRIVKLMDRNGDGKMSKEEAGDKPISRLFDRLIQTIDADKDGMLTAEEMKNIPNMERPGQGSPEYFMPDLNDPSSQGTPVHPVFFVNAEKAPQELPDVARRTFLAETMTAPDNPWFARAYVNRMWSELTGSGFYMPIDDMGPERIAYADEMLDVLAGQFVAHNYDMKWLLKTIVLTNTYQRALTADSDMMFAAGTPTRLRADALYDSFVKALGMDTNPNFVASRRRTGMGGPMGYFRSPRFQFTQLFEFDPSMPQADVTGTIPQALFLMNSQQVEQAIQTTRGGKLTEIMQRFEKDDDVTRELYLTVLSRQPTDSELKIAREYLTEVKNRREAFEDLYWSLLNSSEFLTKR